MRVHLVHNIRLNTRMRVRYYIASEILIFFQKYKCWYQLPSYAKAQVVSKDTFKNIYFIEILNAVVRIHNEQKDHCNT